jgi:hypothetical protein
MSITFFPATSIVGEHASEGVIMVVMAVTKILRKNTLEEDGTSKQKWRVAAHPYHLLPMEISRRLAHKNN